ncbi:MAG: hypothetical protein JW772_00435 [Candidatus Diapherotrites archaeon]|nr:hypothetical protein [Candidatus Diapherotrites archaeon]
MPENTPARLESMYWQKKARKARITIEFDEDDNILECVEKVMRENSVPEVNIEAAFGKIKSGLGNYLEGSKFLTKQFKEDEIKIACGNFKLTKTGLFGVLKIIPKNLDSHVTVAKATAKQGTKIILTYYDFE